MYPSNTSGDASFFHFCEANSNVTNEGFLNYFPPSPLINYDDAPVFYQHLHNIIHQNGDQEVVSHEMTASNCNSKVTDDKFCSADKKESSCEGADNPSQQIRINRRCKKDRHSKIITANGSSRGRRMRLSLGVAKDFFALQDMLEFDKASKTVEWLMIKSENAIRQVKKKCVTGIKRRSSPTSTSVLSAIDELEAEVTTKKKMIIREKGSRKIAALLHPLTRKSREKARARARERTQEKKRLQLGGFGNDESKLLSINLHENVFGSAYNYPLLGCIKSTAAGNNIRTMNPSNPAPALDKSPNYIKHQSRNFQGNIISRQGLIDDSLFITDNWSPYTIVTHHQKSGTTSNEHQVTDFQYDGKNMGDIYDNSYI